MGKNRQRKGREPSTETTATTTASTSSSTYRKKNRKNDASSAALTEAAAAAAAEAAASSGSSGAASRLSLWNWVYAERQGISWVMGCAFLGCILGFGIGTGHLTGAAGKASPWRNALGDKIRSTGTYRFLTWQTSFRGGSRRSSSSHGMMGENLMKNPTHPRVFDVLKEAIVREKGGFVHPDLGMMVPAPSGAARGLGFVRFSYTECQSRCMPGVAAEKLDLVGGTTNNKNNNTKADKDSPMYRQEEILVKVPLSFQMTRQVAVDTIGTLLPPDVYNKYPLSELDDAALLVLLLAHERALGRASRWMPYIATLPKQPSCGYHPELRPYLLDSIDAMGSELGLDVKGWSNELVKAEHYSHKIVAGLFKDYGLFLAKPPPGMTTKENLAWALCQVASRATAGSEQHGTLRLIPMVDLINHDVNAGGFVELTGKEQLGE